MSSSNPVATRLLGLFGKDRTFFGCRRALAEMVPAGRGRIINVASVAGLVGSGGGPAYTASKHGVVGLTRQLAITCAERGITVNAICPGAVQTALRANSTRILGGDAPAVMGGIGASDEAVRRVTPAGRRGAVEEVAATACFLASEAASYVTGHTLVVDGGWTASGPPRPGDRAVRPRAGPRRRRSARTRRGASRTSGPRRRRGRRARSSRRGRAARDGFARMLASCPSSG